jgi:hypothetical protein
MLSMLNQASEVARQLQIPLPSIRRHMTDSATLPHAGKEKGASLRFALQKDWKATSKNRWSVLWGFTIGRTYDLFGTGLGL